MNKIKNKLLKASKIAGGRVALAKKLNVTPQAIHKWLYTDKIPFFRALQIEKITSGKVKAKELLSTDLKLKLKGFI